MNEEIRFDIVVVSRNAGDRLLLTVDNILRQTYPHVHVIVEDGASDDGSFARLTERYETDARVTMDSRTDKGIYDAMNLSINEALRLSDGQTANRYVLFLNCGDFFYKETVLAEAAAKLNYLHKKMAVRAQIAPKEMCVNAAYGDTYDRKSGEVVPANPVMDDFACYRHLPCHQSVFYALEILKEERFDLRWQVRADYEHFLRLKYKRGVKPRYLQMTVADYEGGGFSEKGESRKRSEEERQQIISLYLPREKIFKYDLYRAATIEPLRRHLAENKYTAKLYQQIKRALYGKRSDKKQ